MHNVNFVVCPGDVVSQSDGDTHFISTHQLINLFSVKRAECVVFSPSSIFRREWEGLYILDPRFDGDYSLPDVVRDPCEIYQASDSIFQVFLMHACSFISQVIPV